MAAPTYFASASNPDDNLANTVSPCVITPPASMVAGDLVVVHFASRSAGTLSITVTGGQTWNTLSGYTGGSVPSPMNIYWCRYNGTWAANPSWSSTTSNNTSGVMHVFRPDNGSKLWDIDVAQVTATFAAPTTPFTVTRAGRTTVAVDTVTLAVFSAEDDVTWGTMTGAGWVIAGTAQYRNTAGTGDFSSAFPYYLAAAAGTVIPSVTLNQTALGGDSGATAIVTWKAYSAGDPFKREEWPKTPPAPRRALALGTHVQSTGLGTLRPDITAFNQNDWPLPLKPQRAWSLNTHIEPTDLVVLQPDVNPFRQAGDWGKPPSAPRALSLDTHTRSTDLGNLRPDVEPFKIPAWQLPQTAPSRTWVSGLVAVNLLVTTLAVVAQDPFNTAAATVLPQIAARSVSLLSHTVSTDLGNLQPDVNPFVPRQWPLVPAAPRAWSLNTHLEPTDLLTLRPDVNPFRTPELPVPAKPKPAGVSHLVSTDLNVLRPDVAPFNQATWERPKAGAKPVPDGSFTGLLQTTLDVVVVVQAPFAQTDWPVPKAAVQTANTLGNNLLQTTLDTPAVIQAPFAQFDWALPKTATQPNFSTTSLDLLQTTLADIPPVVVDPPATGSGSGSIIHGQRRKRTGIASNPWDALFPSEKSEKARKAEKARQQELQELEAAIADDDAAIMAVIKKFLEVAA